LDGLLRLVVLVALAIRWRRSPASSWRWARAVGSLRWKAASRRWKARLRGAARAAEVAADLVAAPRPAPAGRAAASEPEKKAEPIEAAAAPEQPPRRPFPKPLFPPPPSPASDGGRAARAELRGTPGDRWVVWVGGVALALGAVFLVRYTIEQGLIGPGVRIMLGALFAAAPDRGRRMVPAPGDTLRPAGAAAGLDPGDSHRRRYGGGLTPRPMRPTRFTASSARARPLCCSTSLAWRRSQPRCCMGPRSPAWV